MPAATFERTPAALLLVRSVAAIAFAAALALTACRASAEEEAPLPPRPVGFDDDSDASGDGEKPGVGKAIGNIMSRVFGGDGDEPGEPLSPLLGQPAPDFELATPQGGKLSLKSLRGKVVVLDFWATWCGPCMQEIPNLQAFHESMKGKGVAVVGVNLGEEADDVLATLKAKGVTFAQVIDPEGVIADRYNVDAIPQTVVIDAAGVVQAVEVGVADDLAGKLGKQVAMLQAGKTLYDPEVVAAARKELLARVAKLKKRFARVGAEQIELVADIPAE